MRKTLFIWALMLLAPSVSMAYVVQPGDTLWSIAQKNNTTVNNLVQQNGIANRNLIYPGQVIDTGSEMLGVGYNPITGYESRTSSYISPTAATIPVVSTKDKSGTQISLTNISSSSTVKVYMNLEPGGTNEEPVICTGVTATSWTGCTRGIDFQGSSELASSSLQKAHNAGSKIIITNIGQFYNQFVGIDGVQTINDVKTFTSFPVSKSAASTVLPTTNGQFATKYYVDTVGAGGFTNANVSSTRGLSADGSSPERVGINVSSTGGLMFDTNGGTTMALQVKAGTGISTNVSGVNWTGASSNNTWTGQNLFSASSTFTATTTIQGVQGGLSPVGSITAYASSTAPVGWLLADGTAVSRATYWNLFSVIGTTYGVGDNSTTFNLPNLAGRQILMASSTANIAQSGGQSNHTMTTDELVAHTHSVTTRNAVNGGNSYIRGTDDVNSGTANNAALSTGNSVPFNVLDPYLVMEYIIKY